MIGLYDRDFIENLKKPFFNIQLMKMSTYYKNKREMVSYVTDLSRAKYYTTIFYFQDNPQFSFAPEIAMNQNIVVMGRAFGITELAPDIEKCEPDVTIYETVWNTCKNQTRDSKQMYLFMTSAAHVTAENLPEDFDITNLVFRGRQRKQIVFHDFKIGERAAALINELTSVYSQVSVAFRHLAIITHPSVLLALTSCGTPGRYNRYFYDGPLSWFQYIDWINNCSKNCAHSITFVYGKNGYIKGESEQELITLVKRILYAKSIGSGHFMRTLPGNEQINYIYSILAHWCESDYPLYEYKYINARSSLNQFVKDNHLLKAEPYIKAYKQITEQIPQLKILFNIDPQIIADNGGIMPL